jgi:predicted aminopeptidase
MERWNVQHRVTCVRVYYCVTYVRGYYETKSVIEVQSFFRRQFTVGRHGRVTSGNTILAG